MPEMVSVIIPSRRERFLNNTIEEVKSKMSDRYEIIVTLDGADAERMDGVFYIYNEESKGMRTAINQAVDAAKGEYLMKLDAHCMLDEGIDRKLKSVHQPNWVQAPRRKRLNAHKWQIIEDGRPDIDYMRLNADLIGVESFGKNKDPKFKKILIDDTDIFQGSCYFMVREFFRKLGLLDDVNFSGSGNEAAEIAYKVREAGGRVIVNKTTWYAHARLGRLYGCDRSKSRAAIRKLYEGNSFLYG